MCADTVTSADDIMFDLPEYLHVLKVFPYFMKLNLPYITYTMSITVPPRVLPEELVISMYKRASTSLKQRRTPGFRLPSLLSDTFLCNKTL